MRGEASSLSRASGGRPRLPPSGAQAAVQLQGCTNSAGQGRTPSKLDKLALSTSDEEVGVPAGSASVVRGGSGSSAWLSRRSRIAVAIAATVLVLSVTVAVVVGVTQAQKSKGSGGDGGSGSLSGASVPPSPPAALAPPQYAMQPPPTRPSPKAAVPPPLRSPAQPPPISAPAAPPASPPAAPRPPVPQLPPPQLSPAPAPTAAPFPVPAGSVALWGDEFAGGSLDSDTWAYDLGAPASAVNAGQLQEYTDRPDNVRVQDGQLLITARKDGDAYTSGRLRSRQGVYPGMQLPTGGTASSVHVEASIQAPQGGPGLWAALWLQPEEERYGGWPMSGEIDVIELIDSMTNVTSGLHYGNQYPENTVADVSVQQPSGQPFSDGPHVYALDWERDAITISVDGVVSRRFVSRRLDPTDGWFTGAAGAPPEAPFDAPFNIILNLAVGGSWPGNPTADTPFPATMVVQYVRVWANPTETAVQ